MQRFKTLKAEVFEENARNQLLKKQKLKIYTLLPHRVEYRPRMEGNIKKAESSWRWERKGGRRRGKEIYSKWRAWEMRNSGRKGKRKNGGAIYCGRYEEQGLQIRYTLVQMGIQKGEAKGMWGKANKIIYLAKAVKKGKNHIVL